MDALRIPLTDITEHGFRVDRMVDIHALQPQGAEGLPVKQVSVRGVMTPMDDEFLFQGLVEGVFVHPCDRCLEEAQAPFSVEVVWTFSEGPEPEPCEGNFEGESEDIEEELDNAGDHFHFQGTELDLSRSVWEEVSLALPAKFVCRPDCKGLCPRCGVNRNREQCSCRLEDEEEFNPFRGLKGKFS